MAGMRCWALALAMTLGGCYELPSSVCGATCTATNGCPDGLRCSSGVCLPQSGGACPSNRLTLTLDNGSAMATLQNVPVAVTLDAATQLDVVTDPKQQLEFTDAVTHAELAFDVESWDPNGTGEVWVKVATLPVGKAVVDLAYGPGAAGHYAPTEVWSDYAAIWHMAGLPLANSTSPDFVGSLLANSTAATEPGQIGSALGLVAPNSEIDVVDGAMLASKSSAYTLELWLDPSSGAGGTGSVISNSHSFNIGRTYVDSMNMLVFQIDLHFYGDPMNTNTQYPIVHLAAGEWNYLAFTFDGSTVWAYRNGAPVDRYPLASPPAISDYVNPSDGGLYFGDTGMAIDGLLDEVRISNQAMTADWIAAQYRSMTGQLVSISPAP